MTEWNAEVKIQPGRSPRWRTLGSESEFGDVTASPDMAQKISGYKGAKPLIVKGRVEDPKGNPVKPQTPVLVDIADF